MRQSLPPCVPSTASFLLFMMIRPQKSTAVHCLTTFHGKWFRMVNHTIPTCPQHNIFGRDLENIMLQCQLTSTTIFLAVCLVSRCLPPYFYSSNWNHKTSVTTVPNMGYNWSPTRRQYDWQQKKQGQYLTLWHISPGFYNARSARQYILLLR